MNCAIISVCTSLHFFHTSSHIGYGDVVAISGDFDGIKLNAFVMIWGEVSTGKRWKVIDMTLSGYIMFDAHAADAHCWGTATQNDVD
jgi:hypothetical protein